MKLHLGCGRRYLDGYVHIDINKFDHIDYYAEVHNLSFINDNVVEQIYASHVLEYYDSEEVEMVLLEWKRVLKPGGELMIAVPNFDSLIKVYDLTNDISKVIGPIIGAWKLSNGNKIFHKLLFDFKSLKSLLEKVGFTNVDYWDWKQFIHDFPDFDDHSQAYFPHMDKENGIHISLNLKCHK